MGRPRFVVPWDVVDELCRWQCSMSEIAAHIGCSAETLGQKCKAEHKMTFTEYFGRKRQKGLESLRKKQLELAEAGDKTMLVWLGKQYLDQKDHSKQEIDSTVTQRGTVTLYMPDNGREPNKGE